MQKRLLAVVIFVAYCAILVKVMVFKDIPTIKVGQLMLNFGGADSGHAPNFTPFATIMPYLFGFKGLIIAGINIVGNIILLVPLGFLLPFVFPSISWKKSLTLGIVSGLVIELLQTVLRVGIFDIDDVILNAFGFMIGYGASIFFTKWMQQRNYKHIVVAAFLVIATTATAFYFVYPWGQPVVNPGVGTQFTTTGNDLCGGTGGNGQIVSIGNNQFTLERKDEGALVVTLTSGAEIKTVAGSGSLSDLKIGDRVTLVGDAHSGSSFTAYAVFVCSQ